MFELGCLAGSQVLTKSIDLVAEGADTTFGGQ